MFKGTEGERQLTQHGSTTKLDETTGLLLFSLGGINNAVLNQTSLSYELSKRLSGQIPRVQLIPLWNKCPEGKHDPWVAIQPQSSHTGSEQRFEAVKHAAF